MTPTPSSSCFYIGSSSPAFMPRLFYLANLLIHISELNGERSEHAHLLGEWAKDHEGRV